ncbi:MAG: glycosyltransferase family 2 protein [Burkholderiales bacterium]
MKFGVALCTYNGERYLRAQLESIAAQSRRPDLLVACDDASRDGTPALLEAWAAQAPFEVRIVRNPANLGYLRNFEQAVALCDADLVALSDQDDCWRDDKLEKLEAVFRTDAQAAAVFSDAEIVDEDLRPLGYGLLDVLRVSDAEREAARAGRLLPVLLRRNVVAGATLALRAGWKSRLLPMPDSVVHDEWIALFAAAHGALRFVPERLIRYRQHAANQIGARRWNLAEHYRSLQRPRRAENRRVLALMNRLRERLGRGDPGIEGKIAHLERRVALPPARLLRLPAIAAEYMNGRYSRYSSGWRTAVRDLISP